MYNQIVLLHRYKNGLQYGVHSNSWRMGMMSIAKYIFYHIMTNYLQQHIFYRQIYFFFYCQHSDAGCRELYTLYRKIRQAKISSELLKFMH